MRTKVTLVLLFLNVALFLFIFHFERDWRTERAALEVRKRVLGPEGADIRSIEVAQAFRLEKRKDSWFLTEPLEWPANPQAVRRIMTDLQFLEHVTSFSVHDVIKNGLSLDYYGLDHPRLVVSLTSGGADTTGGPPIATTLRIGDTAKGGQSLYVLSADGARIHVVGRELADALFLPIDQLRSDSILTIPVFEAGELSIQASGLRVRLHRDGSRWAFLAPIPSARANKDATELAISDLDALRVRSFVAAPPPGPLPSDAPALRVTLEGNNRSETLYLGQRADAGPTGGDHEYYAQLEDRKALFTVAIPARLMEALDNAQEALRDRHVLDFDPAAVTAITLAAPNQPDLTLQRLEAPGSAGTRWQIVLPGNSGQGPQTLRAERDAVLKLLDQLALLSADAFQSDAPQAADLENWGFNRPEREITLGLAAPDTPIVLHLGVATPRDGRAYARLANGSSVYAVGPAILAETPVATRAWRDRLLNELPAGARITGFRITDALSGARVLEWRADAGILSATSAPPPAAAAAAVQSLLAQLRTLRARSFVADSFAESVKDEAGEDRRWRYRLDADLSLPITGSGKEQAGTSTLWLTERTSGSRQYAGSREFNASFSIEQPMIDALWTLTYGSRDPGPSQNPPPAR